MKRRTLATLVLLESKGSSSVEGRTRDRKVAGWSPGEEQQENLILPPGSTFCADSYFGIRSTLVLLQLHVKDPGYSTKSAGGMLQLKRPI